GNATSRELLLEAGVAKADLFIAVTESDEVNMLSCFLARRMGAKHTVARIREREYDEDGLNFLIKELDLSMALNPERLTAERLFNWLKIPSAVSVDNFAGKKICMLEFIVREGSALCNQTLIDIRKKSPVQFVACAVERNDEVYVPNGMFELQDGDKVAFTVKRSEAYKFLKSVGAVQKQGRDVMI
ncbi:MAG: NAD-binding protein, partial [Clostridiales bacterium]|nr:NAD-binding protein [Clostridiales bacterium]